MISSRHERHRTILVMIEPPLPFGNASARWYYVLLKGLVERGHEVTAFATVRNTEDARTAAELFPASEYDLRTYNHPRREKTLANSLRSARRPYSYMFSDELKKDLSAELNKGFDVLHLESLWSGWVGWNHANRALLALHYLFRIDLAAAPPKNLAERLRRIATARAERQILTHYPRIATLTPRLTKRVGYLSPKATVSTIPLGLDVSLYEFANEKPVTGNTIGIIGSFNWEPTRSAAIRLLDRVWPGIKRRIPGAQLQIVGRNARACLNEYLNFPDVTIRENVPDIAPHFANLDVLVYAPNDGSGMKVKILEAFAFGVPVVTNEHGTEGIPAKDGVHLFLAEDDESLIARTVELLEDRGRSEQMRLSARQLLEECVDPDPILDKVESVHASIAEKNRSGA